MDDKPEKIDSPVKGHNVAKVAREGFGKNSAAYDANRPGYTDQIVECVLEEVLASLTHDYKEHAVKYGVLELGAGTGKLTESVSPRLDKKCSYLATEPSDDFLSCLRGKSLPVETMIMSASCIPLPDNSVQNVLCAQCLHWFSNDESFKEINRVLVPGGKLISVYNCKKFEEGKWTMEFYKQRLQAMERTGSSPLNWVNTMEWKKSLDNCGLFSCVRHESLPGIDFKGTLDDMLSHFRSISCYNALPVEECNAFLESLGKAILSYPDVTPNNMTFPFSSEMYVFKTATI